eukprot:TRINITY_DN1982_c0_g3_i1.p1 TRINITY_DN1982_c0_g3~~TRINITY_DN1982_c0_g3_i1.p1  ORF type:complete len:246 (-),score=67.21 TRINITY_DN1982_c0_g3_i1:126-863(-)
MQVLSDKGKVTDGDYTTPRIMLYTAVSEVNTKALRKAQNRVEERKLLQKIFELDKEESVARVAELLLDFYTINLDFVKHVKNYSDEKVSTFLAIMHHTFTVSLKNNLSQRECLQIFKGLLKIHSLARPPDSIGLFSKADLVELEEFFMKTFYRHYPLYESAVKQKADLTLRTLNILQPDHLVTPAIENTMEECKVDDVPVLAELLEGLNLYKPKEEAEKEEEPEKEQKKEEKKERNKEQKKEQKK